VNQEMLVTAEDENPEIPDVRPLDLTDEMSEPDVFSEARNIPGSSPPLSGQHQPAQASFDSKTTDPGGLTTYHPEREGGSKES